MPSALFHRVNNLIIYKLTSYTAIASCLDGLGTAAPYFANTALPMNRDRLYPAAHRDPPAGGLATGTINRMAAPVTCRPCKLAPLRNGRIGALNCCAISIHCVP